MADTHSAQPSADNPAVHHETSDVNIRGIFGFAVGLVIVALVVHFVVWLMFVYFGAREARSTPRQFPLAAAQGQRVPPEPRLQTNPRQDLIDMRTGEDAILDTYSWVDKNQGVVRIPIEEAMKLTVQRGLPTRPANGEKSK
jgi:hypothetical protein